MTRLIVLYGYTNLSFSLRISALRLPFTAWFSPVLSDKENKVFINLPPWMVEPLQATQAFTTNHSEELRGLHATPVIDAVELGSHWFAGSL